MSLGAMTVMSYDIWKAKCAAEKRRLEAEGKTVSGDMKKDDDDHFTNSPPAARKRAHTFVARVTHRNNFSLQDEPKEIPKVSPPNLKEKKGRYILLPTIPAMKVFVGEPSHTSQEPISTASAVLPQLTSAPTMSIPAPLPRPSPIAVTTQNFFNPLSTVAPVVPTTSTAAFGAGLTADQLLASLLPSSMLLGNANLLQQSALAGLLSLAAVPIVAPPSTSCGSDVLSLFRAQQSAQLAAALAIPGKQSLLPSGAGSADDLIQSLLAQTRQPIFSHSL
ncbi:unnamed protein product [Nippostrongylus brasiliensis]|uniref:HMG box domain-containing protein n=1 Tax=Nippostrongylus brasiliensis TaxID=27835 RepID=A0A0N4Y5J9_NIPBR|nr:unnamed protein product [Nippostrongylus brasiliensis]